MSSYISIYIKNDRPQQIVPILQRLSGIKEVTTGTLPLNFHEYILFGETDPTYLVLGDFHNGWSHLQFNSFKKLPAWLATLSADLDTTVVQFTGQTTSDAYYLLIYEKGKPVREIDYFSDDPDAAINKGEPAWMELFPVNIDDGFSVDDLERLAETIGFDFWHEALDDQYYLLKKEVIGETMADRFRPVKQPRSWWQFWK